MQASRQAGIHTCVCLCVSPRGCHTNMAPWRMEKQLSLIEQRERTQALVDLDGALYAVHMCVYEPCA